MDNEPSSPGDASGQLNPALQSVIDNAQTDSGKSWLADAANAVQTYLTRKAVVANSAAAADEFTNNLKDTSDGLVNLVQTDPSAIDLALGLASHTVNGLVSQHQHLDDDTRAGAAAPLIGDMQTEIAHAGVQRLAELNRDDAIAAIDKYGDYLPDDHQAALRQYADIQQGLRQQDAAAQQTQAAHDAALAGYSAASNHLASFTDQDTGGFRAQPGFLSNLMSDTSIAMPTKMALQAGYSMLTRNGDVPQSNPHVAADFLQRIGSDNPPEQGEIMSHLGTGLTINDATFINGLLAPANPQRKADLRTLSDTITQAQGMLASNLNGPGGRVAFGKFTNWLLPALQRGANLTDLMADNRIQQFAPSASDAVEGLPKPMMRLPLGMIFGSAANG